MRLGISERKSGISGELEKEKKYENIKRGSNGIADE